MKVSFVFIGVLFIDAVSRLLKAQEEHRLRKAGKLAPEFIGQPGGDIIKLFYTQRNFYLTGFTLFLSVILARTFGILQANIALEGENRSYKAQHGPLPAAGGASTGKGAPPPPPASAPEEKKAL